MSNLIIKVIMDSILIIVSLIGGYFIYGPKLKKQQKLEFQKEVGKRKAQILLDYKDLIREVETFDIYDIDSEFLSGNTLSLYNFDLAKYPEIFNDSDSFFSFFKRLGELRKKEHYLDKEASAYLIYLYNYIFSIGTFKANNYPALDYPSFGVALLGDFNYWAIKADEVVTRDINRANVIMEDHNGEKWINIREKVFKKLDEHSVFRLLDSKGNNLTEEELEVKQEVERCFLIKEMENRKSGEKL